MAVLDYEGAKPAEARDARPILGWRLASRLFPCLVVLCGFLAVGEGRGQTPPKVQAVVNSPSHVDLEAVFLYHFTQFVEWPPSAFPSTNSPLVIGLLGEHPVAGVLDGVVRGETVKGRPIVVRRLSRLDEMDECHLLFVSASMERQVGRILQQLRGRPILSVSDIDGYAARGGSIEFVTESKKIRLRINADTARAANLNISSKLLRLAEVVK